MRGKRYVLYGCLLALLDDRLLPSYSVLPAMSLDGVLHLDIINTSWKGATFYSFIDALLDNMNPFPQRNSVVVMDNASIHHSPELRELVESR